VNRGNFKPRLWVVAIWLDHSRHVQL